MDPLKKISKAKHRKLIVLSAGSILSGIQGIYIEISNESFQVIAHTFVPYPEKTRSIILSIGSGNGPAALPAEIARLDRLITLLSCDCYNSLLSKSPKTYKRPNCIVFNGFQIFCSQIDDQSNWDITLGDAQYIASVFGIPTFTDMVRHHILSGGLGDLPLNTGYNTLTTKTGSPCAFINFGMLTHATVIDSKAPAAILESDCGPGTMLLNAAAQECGSADGFDRDGSLALKGTVDSHLLDELAHAPWFEQPAPKRATGTTFENIAAHPALAALSCFDRLATLTALTARTCYDLIRREVLSSRNILFVWVSGGGANNHFLIDCLKTYFGSIQIKNIEELGIPADMTVPLALGLTINSMIQGKDIGWNTGSQPQISRPGKWVIP